MQASRSYSIFSLIKQKHVEFNDQLSPSAKKLKLGWLFNKYSKIKPWKWEIITDNNHWHNKCLISEQWKQKWDDICFKNFGNELYDVFQKKWMLRRSRIRVAMILNEATAEFLIIFRYT